MTKNPQSPSFSEMKIVLVNNFYLPRLSGSAHLTEGLARTLSLHGHDVLVLTSAQGAPAGEEFRDGYRIVRLPCWEMPKSRLSMRYDVNFVTSPKNIRKVFKLLGEFRPDILHQHGQFFDLTWITEVWVRLHRVPSVLTVHTPLVAPSQLLGTVLWLGDQAAVRPFLAIGKPHVVVVDKFMRDYVYRRYHLPQRSVSMIPLGIDIEKFSPRNEINVRAKYNLGDDPVILSIGHVIPLRNRLGLIECLPKLLEQVPNAKVLILGNVLDDSFLIRAAELGVADSVIAIGQVPHNELPSYFQAADLECHDLQGYGLGTSTLEVMAAGVPVVAVVEEDNFPGIEFVNGRDIAMAKIDDPSDLANSIADVLTNPSLSQSLSAGEQDFVRKYFDLEAVTNQHEDLYKSVIEGARSARNNRKSG
jgi:glycosyltransferase involved in cell wall biosynthesis